MNSKLVWFLLGTAFGYFGLGMLLGLVGRFTGGS